MKKKSIQQENKGKIEKELQNFVYIPNICAKSLEFHNFCVYLHHKTYCKCNLSIN